MDSIRPLTPLQQAFQAPNTEGELKKTIDTAGIFNTRSLGKFVKKIISAVNEGFQGKVRLYEKSESLKGDSYDSDPSIYRTVFIGSDSFVIRTKKDGTNGLDKILPTESGKSKVCWVIKSDMTAQQAFAKHARFKEEKKEQNPSDKYKDPTILRKPKELLDIQHETFVAGMNEHTTLTAIQKAEAKAGLLSPLMLIAAQGKYSFILPSLPTANNSLFKPLKNGNLTQAQTRLIIEQLLIGLNNLHNLGFVHRGISPENILINDRLEATIANFAKTTGKGEEGVLSGQNGYFSPEIMQKLIDSKQTKISTISKTNDDMWAMGLVLLQLIGKTPLWLVNGIKDLQALDTPKVITTLQDAWAKDLGLKEEDPLECLIMKMLKIDSKARITADEALTEFKQIPLLSLEQSTQTFSKEITYFDLLDMPVPEDIQTAKQNLLSDTTLSLLELVGVPRTGKPSTFGFAIRQVPNSNRYEFLVADRQTKNLFATDVIRLSKDSADKYLEEFKQKRKEQAAARAATVDTSGDYM